MCAQRQVFVMAKKLRAPRKLWALKIDEIRQQKEDSDYGRRLAELRALTKELSQYVKEKDAARKQDVRPVPEKVLERDLEQVYRALEAFDASTAALALPVMELPAAIERKLGSEVRHLVSKEGQNWRPVIQALARVGLDGVSRKDSRKLVYSVPPEQLRVLFPDIVDLFARNSLPISQKIKNAYIKSLLAGPVDEAALREIQRCAGGPSRVTFELLVEAYGKNGNLEMVNSTIREMQKRGIQPLPRVYSNVLATCVYKARDHEQAVALFDTMRFVGSPGAKQFQDIVVSYVNSGNVEKALDIYEEMATAGVEATQQVLVALARGCMARQELRAQAWDFVFEIERRGWKPTVPTLEYVLFMAAKDGDVALARALYHSLHSAQAASRRLFTFLMLAYAHSQAREPPAIAAHAAGRVFRSNLLALTENSTLPFLPTQLLGPREAVAELAAMMAFTMETLPHFVNEESVNSYLNVAASLGTLDEFEARYTRMSFLDRPVASTLLDAATYKVPRSTVTYMIALKAAARHRAYAFAQAVWTERGRFRKTPRFRALPAAARDKLDFDFASAMVHALTQMMLLDDALAILVSTEYQFRWTWVQLRPLCDAAQKVGNDKVVSTVRGIAKRAQVNFEGKVRRKDYKLFTLQSAQ